MCQALDEPLKSFLCVGSQSSVVSKEHLSEQELRDFVLGSGMGEIEQLKIKRVRRRTPSSDALKAEEDAEEGNRT